MELCVVINVVVSIYIIRCCIWLFGFILMSLVELLELLVELVWLDVVISILLVIIIE